MPTVEKTGLLEDERIAKFDKVFMVSDHLVDDPTVLVNSIRTVGIILDESTSDIRQACSKQGDKVITQIDQFDFNKEAVEVRTVSGKKHWYEPSEIKGLVEIAKGDMKEVKVINVESVSDVDLCLLIIKCSGFYLFATDIIKENFLDNIFGTTKDDVEKSSKKQTIIRGGAYCI